MEAMQRLAQRAVAEFGRIDTWVNSAGVSAYGRIEEVTLRTLAASSRPTPEVVAEDTLRCASHPQRNGLVGGAGKLFSASEKYAPRLFDRMKEATGFAGQYSGVPALDRDILHAPRPSDSRVRGGHPGHVMQSSLYTKASLHSGTTLLGLAVIDAGMMLVSRAGRAGNGARN